MIITSGKYHGRKVSAPDEKITRPTLSQVRMSIFNTLFSLMGDFSGKSFLDMFGGSGIMGLEALSRGFSEVKVFEINKKSANVIKNNYSSLGLSADLNVGDSLKLIKTLKKKYDVVFIDPPYECGIYGKILKETSGGIIVVEHSEDISLENFELIKQKKYGGKYLTFLKEKL